MAEKEYIEREAIAKHIDQSFGEVSTPIVVREIRNFPTADVTEVKHGEWVKTDNIPNKEHILVECSLCHSGHYLKKFLNDSNGEQTYKHHCETVRFCSSCGAKMDGEKR